MQFKCPASGGFYPISPNACSNSYITCVECVPSPSVIFFSFVNNSKFKIFIKPLHLVELPWNIHFRSCFPGLRCQWCRNLRFVHKYIFKKVQISNIVVFGIAQQQQKNSCHHSKHPFNSDDSDYTDDSRNRADHTHWEHYDHNSENDDSPTNQRTIHLPGWFRLLPSSRSSVLKSVHSVLKRRSLLLGTYHTLLFLLKVEYCRWLIYYIVLLWSPVPMVSFGTLPLTVRAKNSKSDNQDQRFIFLFYPLV